MSKNENELVIVSISGGMGHYFGTVERTKEGTVVRGVPKVHVGIKGWIDDYLMADADGTLEEIHVGNDNHISIKKLSDREKNVLENRRKVYEDIVKRSYGILVNHLFSHDGSF